MTRRLSLPMPDEDSLERVSATARPFGLSTGARSYELLRETFFDTSDGALRQEGMSLRLRHDARGLQTLDLRILTSVSLEGIVEESVLEASIVRGGLYATLAESSELASRIRAIVEPPALRPQVALDIDRELRDLKGGWLGLPVHRMLLDRIVAHGLGAVRTAQELAFVELAPKKPSLEELADRVRDDLGLLNDGLDTFERVRRALSSGADALAGATTAEPRVAVLVLRDGRVALVDGAVGLTVPTARGAGEDRAREHLGVVLGRADPAAELELVGFAAVPGGGADLEVWIHTSPPSPGDADRLVWMPLVELLERVGAPRLREPILVAALLLLARSDLGFRLLREVLPDRSAPARIGDARLPAGQLPDPQVEAYLDPELSILDFNQRVLELAEDVSVPLLERFRFLSIFSSNMDEFVIVRMGRLKTTIQQETDDDGLVPALELLDLIAIRLRALAARQYACLNLFLLPALAGAGIRIRRWADLDPDQRAALTRRFEVEIFPILTPQSLSVSSGRPFPRIETLRLSLGVILRDQDGVKQHFAHVPIPADLPRFLLVPGSEDLVAVEDVVEANAASLFPSSVLRGSHPFRVSRLREVEIDEDESESLLEAVQDEVESRPFKPVLRLEVHRSMPRELRAHLLRELRSEPGIDTGLLSRGDVFEVDGPIDLRAFSEVSDLAVPGGRYPIFRPCRPLSSEPSIFDVLSRREVLVHHPFDAFDDTVARFLAEAARDPKVVSIKLTLYRTGRNSPVVSALLDALKQGKDVSVFVELRARFDEENNIEWTHRLKEAGGQVIYGLAGLKTHAKTALVVRREEGVARRYVHIGTGNYNAATARFYTDLGIMSSDPELGADLNDFFNELTGSAGPPIMDRRKLWVAPRTLAPKLLERIEREIEHARAGKLARIQAKLNGLTDRTVVQALYVASQAGVEVDLVVRGICTLRPGVPGLSDNIRIRSILGRFLEHARIYYFENAGQGEYFIGSADWRKRNVRRRVEVVVPVGEVDGRRRLRSILDAELADPRAWILRSDGAYERLAGEGVPAQERFVREAEAR